jgi:beta-glucosidase
MSTIDYVSRAQRLVIEMTLDEKATLLSGDGWWETHPIERVGIPSIMMTDGPHGVRKVAGSPLSPSVPATCFPTASALAASWNTDLLREVGVALAKECQANDVQILLGPGVNMKRSPLGGRNFEYFSEDPLLAGDLAAAYIEGVQSLGVGTSLKHFAANNQEFERMVMSSNLDERTLHEIYLPAFEIAVKKAQPWSVMCAYNKVNGVYASENELLLRRILKEQWGFTGFVVSDWGAINDRVKGINAGLHLEMPGSADYNRKKIVAGVKSGEIALAQLDLIVVELLSVILLASDNRRPELIPDLEQHNLLARNAAAESIVLLKNENRILPLDLEKTPRIAISGIFAKSPRYQGAGSSLVNPTQVLTAYEELVKICGAKATIEYSDGYAEDGSSTSILIEEAARLAGQADVAIIFAGLPDSYESEGFDRASLEMPAGHNELIERIVQVQSNVVVVLLNGSAVRMPWASKVTAIIEGWLGGQAGGGAIADILTGLKTPSGKLSETFPMQLEQTPTYPEFPALNKEAVYREGLFIGYRYYDTKKLDPLFPFGFGLSYTEFEFSDIQVSASKIKETGFLTIQVNLKNIGKVAGQEVIQLYVHEQKPAVIRPDKELKAFTKVALAPGEEKTVRLTLNKRSFAYYNDSLHDWSVNPGKFDLLIGNSARNLPLKITVEIEPTVSAYPKLKPESLLKEFRNHPAGSTFFNELSQAFGLLDNDEQPEKMVQRTPAEEAARKKADMSTMAFLDDMPANKAMAFSGGAFSEERLEEILELTANQDTGRS